jgi:hypothetical protein
MVRASHNLHAEDPQTERRSTMPSPRDFASGTMSGGLTATPAATAGHLRSRTGPAPAPGASSKRESLGLSVARMASTRGRAPGPAQALLPPVAFRLSARPVSGRG